MRNIVVGGGCPPIQVGQTIWKFASDWLQNIAQRLIGEVPEHRHLNEARIALLVKCSVNREKKDDNPAGPKRVHLGKAGKAGPKDKLLSKVFERGGVPIDFWIWVDGDWMESVGVFSENEAPPYKTHEADGNEKVAALLDHELSHCGITIKGTFVYPTSLKAFVEDLGTRHVETCNEVVDKKGRVLVRYHAQDKALNPVWKMRQHDVEDFVGVLARHGAWTDDLKQLVDELTPPKDPDLLDGVHDKVPA